MSWSFVEECIAAIATALSPAGLGVIRLSGKDCIKIAANFFKSSKSIEKLKGYEATYGKILDGDCFIDDAVVLVFKAPNSYTGEDVVEISCHGGLLILESILKLCIKYGAKAAKRGEFTKRAFLNGKLSLTQAEAVVEVINADSESFLKAANKIKQGMLYKIAEEVKKKLVEIDGKIAVFLDYPEEDLPDIEIDELEEELKKQKEKLEEVLKNSRFETILRSGIKVAIVGKSNVGKSTLMNLICGEEKSIVTNIHGTTRDLVENCVEINGIKFKFYDTAGIRETKDVVEKKGIEKTKQILKEADIILFVTDNLTKEEDLNVLKDIENCNKILIYNKTDLNYIEKEFSSIKFSYVVRTSDKDLKSIENLKQTVYKIKDLNIITEKDDVLILNSRQKESILKSIENLEKALESLKEQNLIDAAQILIESAIEDLLQLTGEKVSDLVLDEIFSKFCVGK